MKKILWNCSQTTSLPLRSSRVSLPAIAGLAAAVCLAASFAAPARAVEYPWCLYYGMGGGGHNCGFVSFSQCLASASGTGGHCSQNPGYSPSAGPRSGYYAPHRYYRHYRHHRHY